MVNQAFLLAAVADARGADVILDLGTGAGNSAAVFALACPAAAIYTFDREDKWSGGARRRLEEAGLAPRVIPVDGDLTTRDFAPLVGAASSVVVFWDAHGFDVAQHVLGHLMPLIADRRHVVICHDMCHAAFSDLDYAGKPLWRGMELYNAVPGNTSRVVIGWAIAVVDQLISIADFCTRNDMAFRSVDTDVHIENRARVGELQRAIGEEASHTFAMGYFSMNETTRRRFPARS